jgi:glycosyltransferase involved in cell wall biosynthesis
MPSYFESFGLSIAEAQAAGLPVVAYAAGSVPEVVRDGHTGWLAPARDIRALAERIGAALADPAEAARRGAAGRERAAAEFDWRRTGRILYGGLAALAAARSSSSLPA